MLTVNECIVLPSLTEGHDAYSHFYLPHLRGAAPSSPGAYSFQVIRFTTRDMTDNDCRQIAEAIKSSFDAFGPDQCSSTVLREVGVSGNPFVSNEGIRELLDGLLYVARFGRVHEDAVDALDDDTEASQGSATRRNPLYQLHTIDVSELPCILSMENQTLLMNLVRAVPGLRTVRVPAAASMEVPPPPTPPLVEDTPSVSEGETGSTSPTKNMFEAEERAERERSTLIHASQGFSYSVKRAYTVVDFERNAELNEFPGSVKRAALAAGRAVPRFRKALLQGSMTPDDIERDFPKTFHVRSATAISSALAFNNSIVKLDFSNNNVGDESTIALAECLKTNQTLSELILRNNSIGYKGGMALNNALLCGPNKTLLELDLSDNCINDLVVQAFHETVKKDVTHLGTLRLERNCVTPARITSLYQALMLNTQPKEMKRVVPLLEANDSRVSKVAFNSGEDRLDDISMKVLLHAVRSNTHVTLIDVSNNTITDEGAFFIAEMIESVTSLRKVIAQFNNIGEDGARRLLRSIPRSKHVEKVDLKFQDPPVDGHLLQVIEKVAGLSNQPKPVRENGLALTENDPEITALDLSLPDGGARRCDDETIETLSVLLESNTFLVDLNVSCNPGRVTVKSMPILAALGLRLTCLNLNACDFGDADIEPLFAMLTNRKCPLHTLMLEHNELTSVSAKRFTDIIRDQNDTVTVLSLHSNRRVSKDDHDALQFYCDLNTHAKAFKSIVLTVEANRDRRLTTLDFCFVDKLNATGTSHGFRKEFGDLSAKLLCVALAQNDSVKTVNMCGNRITDVGAGCFARLLRTNVTLTHLDLSYNEITDDGLMELYSALRTNTTVKCFVFEGNKSKNPEVAKQLQQALHSNTVSVSTPYTAAMNMTGKKPELGVDPRLQQYAIEKMVGTAILEDALNDLKKPPRVSDS